MAFRRFKRRATKRPRHYRRRRTMRRRKFTTGGAVVRYNKQPFPSQLYTRFQYVIPYTNLSVGPGYASHTLSGNSLFDVDITGTTHQCMYYDQASAVYANYRVFGAKYHIRAKVRDASAIESAKIVVYALRSGQSSPSTLDQAEELPRSKSLLVSKDTWRHMTFYADQAAVSGLSRSAYRAREDTSAGVGSDPGYLNYLQILANSIDLTTGCFIDFDVHITYYVQMWGLKTVAQS